MFEYNREFKITKFYSSSENYRVFNVFMEGIEIKKSKLFIIKEKFLSLKRKMRFFSFKLRKKLSVLKKKYLRLSTVKVIITIISIIGFLYQSYVTTEEYFHYRTTSVTKTEYELQKFTEVPAVTFCSEVFFDLEKLKSKFPNIENSIQDISKRNSSDIRSAIFTKIYKFLQNNIENFSLNNAFDYSIDLKSYVEDCNVNNGSKTRSCRNRNISIEKIQDNRKCETYWTHLLNENKSMNLSRSISSIGYFELLFRLNKSSLILRRGIFNFIVKEV